MSTSRDPGRRRPRIRSVLAAVAIALTVLASTAPTVGAQGYGTLDDGTVSDSSPAPGQTVDLVIDGFLPDSQVSVVLRSDPIALGTFTADGDGVLRTSVVIPAGVAAGSHSIVASGVNAANEPVTATIAITVAAVGSGALPSTGGDIAAVLTVSVALLAAGIASMLVGRRRRGAPS